MAFNPTQQGIIDTLLIQKWLTSLVRDYIALLLVGLFALWLFPGHLRRWGDKAMRAPFSSLGLGLVVAIVGTFALVLLWALILALALGVGRIGFSGLGTAMGLLGFFAISTAGAVLYVIVVFISKLVFAFQAGFLILRKFERTGFWYRLGVLALGLLIYVLLTAIPYIGWAVAVVVMMIGTGAIFLVFNDDRRFEKQAAAASAPEIPVVEQHVETVPASAPTVVDQPSAESIQPAAPVNDTPDPATASDDTPSAGTPTEDKPVKPKSPRKTPKPQDE